MYLQVAANFLVCICRSASMRISYIAFQLLQLTLANVWLDTHSHAVLNNAEIWTPTESIAWHIRNGFNAMAITNHNPDEMFTPAFFADYNNYTSHASPNVSNIVLLPGREFDAHNMHIVLLFNPADYADTYALGTSFVGWNEYFCHTKQELVTLISHWHTRDVLVVFAHPHLLKNPCAFQPTWQEVREMGFDYVERITSSIYDYTNEKAENDAGLKVLAGTDGHSRVLTGPNGFTRAIITGNITAQAIYDALKAGSVWVEYDVRRLGWYYILLIVLGSVLVLAGIIAALVFCHVRKSLRDFRSQ